MLSIQVCQILLKNPETLMHSRQGIQFFHDMSTIVICEIVLLYYSGVTHWTISRKMFCFDSISNCYGEYT